MLLDDIPEYRERKAKLIKEQAERQDAEWVDVPLDICGLPIVPLTLRRMTLLFLGRSPFLCGGSITPGAIAQFIWIMSPEFEPGDNATRGEVTRHVAGLPWNDVIDAINKFLEASLADRPPGTGGHSGLPIASFAAYYVHRLASTYGWDDDKIMEMPIGRVYQLAKIIGRENNPSMPAFSAELDKLNSEFLGGRN